MRSNIFRKLVALLLGIVVLFFTAGMILKYHATNKDQELFCDGFDSKLWKKDRYGCKGHRKKLLVVWHACFKRGKSTIKGCTRTEVEMLLGKPNKYLLPNAKRISRSIYVINPNRECRKPFFIKKSLGSMMDEGAYQITYRNDTVIASSFGVE